MKVNIAMILFTISLAGCGANNGKSVLNFGDNNRAIETLPPGSVVSFQKLKTMIIGPKCLNCHSAASGNAGGVNLENYENTFSNLSLIKSEVTAGTMPPRTKTPLTQTEKDILISWINAGGPEGGVDNPSKPPIEKINYATINTKVLIPKCITCHSDRGGNKGDVNLESYENVLGLSNSIESEIESGSMPPKKKPLTPEEKSLILKWLSMGAPKE